VQLEARPPLVSTILPALLLGLPLGIVTGLATVVVRRLDLGA
jgi:hypothetical protein